ncbi:uncharacterized protein PHACADRAFT_261605 [Phanerochaete carnosa HHB-10118-sp]|uniref:Uncharacterized protein n=1 Tax=Phanerochaete carnosa (strain HHB-10118-sp) TaxID=650164 RepID=K5WRB6_PHACS|nr:uncharacterized protein PHACADRAFT_261605 [Phanerochaete carnosa HHB-10118-sp]EKM52912.1 hypothetical protein PHACADRAFT_261605 [Phanerochaete carnosa HHB-10118-sp]
MTPMSRRRRPMPPNQSRDALSHLYKGTPLATAPRCSFPAAPTMPPVVPRIPVVPVPLSNLASR